MYAVNYTPTYSVSHEPFRHHLMLMTSPAPNWFDGKRVVLGVVAAVVAVDVVAESADVSVDGIGAGIVAVRTLGSGIVVVAVAT